MQSRKLKISLFFFAILTGFLLFLFFQNYNLKISFASNKTLSISSFSKEELSKMIFKVDENSIVFDPWLNGFPYRKPITISNSGSALTDYQVSVTLDTASLISAGKMRSGCGDIRFTDSDGTTQLNYWLESGCNTASTKIWVKVPSIPASSTKTIYVYYGNPSATSLSNAANTLLVYEDWSSGTLGGWTLRTTAAGYTASIITAEGNPPPAVKIEGDNFASDYNQFIYKTITKPAGIGLRIIADHAGYHGYYTSNVFTQYFIYTSGGTFIESYNYNGDANDVWIYNDQYLATNPNTLSNTSLWVGFGLWDAWSANWNQNARFDNIRVMLYTSPEPTTSVGAEDVLITQSGSPTSWSWKVPASGEQVKSGSATSWTWKSFTNDGTGITVPRGGVTSWQWGP
jgi:hypothetical protein